MSSGLLPPMPDLIPITSLRKKKINEQHSVIEWNYHPCTTRSEVMGEQRSRRTGKQPSVDLIDSSRSRGLSATPQTPQSRKTKSERHRKSDRRRDHSKSVKIKSFSKHSCSKTRDSLTPAISSPARTPINPSVNPIFVWVRQENNCIVDVKCEDYDKRNRILLTKTAQGWRAIPRTKTLVSGPKEVVDKEHHHHHHHHHHHRNRKSRKSKVRRKSTAVQVDSDIDDNKDEKLNEWMTPVNVESLLPSHTIVSTKPSFVPSEEKSELEDTCIVNSVIITESAHPQSVKCSVDKTCDVTPLENLLAVAELEFNQQIQYEERNKTNSSDQDTSSSAHLDSVTDEKGYCEMDNQKDFMESMEHLNNLIESCSNSKNDGCNLELNNEFDTSEQKSDCDYNDDDDNNLAMDDILSRLEQSLRSPECTEIGNVLNACEVNFNAKLSEDKSCFSSDINENNYKNVPDFETFFEDEPASKLESGPKVVDNVDKSTKLEDIQIVESIVESSTSDEPTDLSVKVNNINLIDNLSKEVDEPTDLSIPKCSALVIRRETFSESRPPSRNSEAIQSPQPSGIPAVPPSPDIVSTSATLNKVKPVVLKTLLSNSSQKIALNSEVSIIRQKEPLDLGKCRKSASPTVTCSQEFNNIPVIDLEPPMKKCKLGNGNSKNSLELETFKSAPESEAKWLKNCQPDTPRLLELLKTDLESDPLAQLRQLLTDPVLSVPDPMLVPKEKLSMIISHPAKEIPKLLKQRPELKLPEALAFPHLLQDPDILVITLQQLETIILKQSKSDILKHVGLAPETQEKCSKQFQTASALPSKETHVSSKKKCNEIPKKPNQDVLNKCGINELANDIDAATTAAFNQMMWLPYLNHMEAMSNNPDMMKLVSNTLPMYSNQIPDLTNVFANNNRFTPPMGLPMQSQLAYNNSVELSMWQEAIMQANMLRSKNSYENFNPKHQFREYIDKISPPPRKPPFMSSMSHKQAALYAQSSSGHSSFQNGFLNIPNSYQSKHLQIPQFNSMYAQKNLMQKSPKTSKISPNILNIQAVDHSSSQKQNVHNYSPKLISKSISNQHKVALQSHKDKLPEKQQTSQPIDLSGSTTQGSKLKVKQHLIDPASKPKLLKHDEVAEVGSTTISIEEMQEAHKHLWHPLFGMQKGYTSPWNWTTVTTSGE